MAKHAQSLAADLAKLNPAAAVVTAVTKEKPVHVVTEKERSFARQILSAYNDADAASALGWRTVCKAIGVEGLTFAGLEAAEPKIKESVPYRSAKSYVQKALAAGVKVIATDGEARSRDSVAEETKAKSGKVPNVEPEEPKAEPLPDVTIKAAFALLMGKESLREKYVKEFTALAGRYGADATAAANMAKLAKQKKAA